jgi:hypothetical protein
VAASAVAEAETGAQAAPPATEAPRLPTSSFTEIHRQEMRKVAPQRAPEAATETAARTARRAPQPVEAAKTGLCLSGGGIRSAAFSLGVLQALNANKAFPQIDFLSTVSGGGYAGAALIAGLQRGDGKFPFDTAVEKDPSREEMEPADIADSKAVKSIRDRCRYLMPNGVLDLIVSLGIILRGLATNVVTIAAAVFIAATVTIAFNPTVESLGHSWLYYVLGTGANDAGTWLETRLGAAFLLTKLMAMALGLWLVAWAVWRSVNATPDSSDALLSDPGSPPAKATALALIAFAIIVVCELQSQVLAWARGWAATPAGWSDQWSDFSKVFATLTAGTGLLAVTWRSLLGLIQSAAKDPTWAALIQKITSSLVLFALALALPLLIYVSYLWVALMGIREVPMMGIRLDHPYPLAPDWLEALPVRLGLVWPILVPALVIALIVVWSSRIGPLSETLFSKRWLKSDEARGPETRKIIIQMAVIAVVTLALGYVLSRNITPPTTFLMPIVFTGIAITLFLVASLFTENANSLHRLYRDRLTEAFNLRGKDDQPLFLSDLAATQRPYPIINTAVNIQGSKKNARGRNADFFIFTPEHVGSDTTGYVSTADYRKAEPHLDLGTVVAVSGAAVSSAMGKASIAVLAPTLALLNVRLGFWVRNPNRLNSAADYRKARLDDWKFPYLYYEMFGRMNEERSKLYLSDGGHIDNLGLYQLLKRRCKVIIVCDAEADPAMRFASFVDVERFARIDLGVRLDLPLQSITEAALTRQAALKTAGAARSAPHAHAAVGTITYPATGTLPEETGYILYVKAAVTGDERSYVLDYEKRFPQFPHESTGDQFFSEEQFEAYRALGFHAMDHGLKHSDGSARWTKLLTELRSRLKVTP